MAGIRATLTGPHRFQTASPKRSAHLLFSAWLPENCRDDHIEWKSMVHPLDPGASGGGVYSLRRTEVARAPVGHRRPLGQAFGDTSPMIVTWHFFSLSPLYHHAI